MSAEIKSVFGSRNVRVEVEDITHDATAIVSVRDTAGAVHTATVTRADLLAAVESETNVRIVPADAIVIERGELPPVDLTSDGLPWADGVTIATADVARRSARAYLALAEYLDAHPPIDEAAVEAIRSLVSVAIPDNSWAERDEIARRLVEAGVRAPEATA